MPGSRRRGLVLARTAPAVAAAFALAGCAASGPGPLILSTDDIEMCVSVPIGERIVLGDMGRSAADATAQLESLELVGAVGVDMEEASVIDPDEALPIGTASYPPDAEIWDARTMLEEAAVRPTADFNVAAVVRRTAETARLDAFRLTYTVDGRRFTVEGTTEFVLADHCE